MTGEQIPDAKANRRSIDSAVLRVDAYWGTGIFAGDRRRRVLGMAACEIPSDHEVFPSPTVVVEDQATPEDPDARYVRYRSDGNGYSLEIDPA